MRITFEKISINAIKRGKCSCGKYLTRAKKFTQTLNPFNLKEGRPKTSVEIYAELSVQRDAWTIEPVHCATLSYWEWSKEDRKTYDSTGQVTIMASCGHPVAIKKDKSILSEYSGNVLY